MLVFVNNSLVLFPLSSRFEVAIHFSHFATMESVPEGLVSVSDKVSAELGGIDAVDVGDIVQLWKGTFTNVLHYPVTYPI